MLKFVVDNINLYIGRAANHFALTGNNKNTLASTDGSVL